MTNPDNNETKKDNEIPLSGYVERVKMGKLIGWAANMEQDYPLTVLVFCNKRLIGAGKADLYREDLFNAGIHKGNHGFLIDVDLSHINTPTTFQLVDADNNSDIVHNKFHFTPPNNKIVGEIRKVGQSAINVNLYGESSIGEKTVRLMCDEEEIGSQHLDTIEKTVLLNFQAHPRLFNNKSYLLKLVIDGYPEIVAANIFTFSPIQTPWLNVKEFYKTPNILSLPIHSLTRFESLKFNLDSPLANSSLDYIQNINKTFDVVVKGYEQNELFQPFSVNTSDKPKASIIITLTSEFAKTYHCLASLALAFNSTPYEVLLIKSTESQIDETKLFVGSRVVGEFSSDVNLNLINSVLEQAKGEYIVFLSSNTELCSYWLDELIGAMFKNENAAIAGSKVIDNDGNLLSAGGIISGKGQLFDYGNGASPFSPEYNYFRVADYVHKTLVCTTKSYLKELNGLSTEFSYSSFEHVDLSLKAKDLGYVTIYVPTSQVICTTINSYKTKEKLGENEFPLEDLKAFRRKWHSSYKSSSFDVLNNLPREIDREKTNRILVIDNSTPKTGRDAGSYAAYQEMKVLQSLGCKVTFVALNLAHFGEYTSRLQNEGIEVLYAPFYTSLPDVINRRIKEMDAVYVTRYSVAEKVIDEIRKISDVKIIFNNADLHFLRELRSLLNNPNNSLEIKDVLKTRERELSVCSKVDAILCYNTTEHAVISSHLLEQNKQFFKTPWVLYPRSQVEPFNTRKGLCFLGNYSHFPNLEAVQFLVQKVMPLLHKVRPDLNLYLYGSNMPESFSDFDFENVHVKGFVDDLDEVYGQHKIFVAPLLSGAGIKGKVLDTLSYGLPSVLSEIAAEGTGLTQAISTSIASTPESWVDEIVKIYDDEVVWQKYSNNVVEIADKLYSFEHARNEFRKILEYVGIYSTDSV